MRKQTKIAAIVSAAALLAIGASMTSFAGWQEEPEGSGEWVYYDRYGYADTDAFHRGNGENSRYWYYVGPDGVMLKDELFQYGDNGEWYYAHSDGRRATNEWVEIEAGENDLMYEDDLYVNSVWYYFGPDGQAVRSRKDGVQYASKELRRDNSVPAEDTGKFVFDTEGRMMVGLVGGVDIDPDDPKDEGDWYYCVQPGDSYNIEVEGTWNYFTGQALNGWARMEPLDIRVEHTSDVGDDGYVWYYFDKCKLLTNQSKKLSWEGKSDYYYFGEDGVMSSADTLAAATSSDAGPVRPGKVYVNDGVIYNGNSWLNYEDDNWYYIVNIRNSKGNLIDNNKGRGVIFNSDGSAVRMKRIDGKLFAFKKDGQMITGAYQITEEDTKAWEKDKIGDKYYWNGIEYSVPAGAKEDAWFYFDDSKDHDGDRGEQRVGKQTYDVDGEEYTRYFARDGKALTGVFDGYLFEDGLLFTPIDGELYKAFDLNPVGGYIMRYRTTGTEYKQLSSSPMISKGKGENEHFVIVDRNGRLVRSSNSGLVVGEHRYTIKDYVATLVPES